MCEEDLGCSTDDDCCGGRGVQHRQPRLRAQVHRRHPGARSARPASAAWARSACSARPTPSAAWAWCATPPAAASPAQRCYTDRDCKVPLVCFVQTGACLPKAPPCVVERQLHRRPALRRAQRQVRAARPASPTATSRTTTTPTPSTSPRRLPRPDALPGRRRLVRARAQPRRPARRERRRRPLRGERLLHRGEGRLRPHALRRATSSSATSRPPPPSTTWWSAPPTSSSPTTSPS